MQRQTKGLSYKVQSLRQDAEEVAALAVDPENRSILTYQTTDREVFIVVLKKREGNLSDSPGGDHPFQRATSLGDAKMRSISTVPPTSASTLPQNPPLGPQCAESQETRD